MVVGSQLLSCALSRNHAALHTERERINEIVPRIISAGLFLKWVRQLIVEAELILVKQNRHGHMDEAEMVNKTEFPVSVFYGWA